MFFPGMSMLLKLIENWEFLKFRVFWGCSCSWVSVDVMPVFPVFICVICGHLDAVEWCIMKLYPVLSCKTKLWSCLWSDDLLLSFLDIDRFDCLTFCVKFNVFSYWLCIFHSLYHYDILTIFCSSVSPHLLELYWSTLCASLCSFIIIYYVLLCIIMYMCPLMCFLYIPMCTCVHICFSLMAFLCYLFCSYVLFVYISVICMCISHLQECGLYVSFTKHTILVKILNLQDTGFLTFHLFVCLCVLCAMCFLVLYHLFFFHLLCMTLFPPFALWFAHYLWFDLGFV